MVVEPIKEKKKIDALLIFLKGKSERDWLLAKVQLNTGLRISDIVGIKVASILTDKGSFKDYFVLSEKKTKKEKKIKLNDSVKRALKEYIKDSNLQQHNYIFVSRKGENEPIAVTQAYRVLKEAANAVGIENFGTHSLRKTWGFWSYKASRYNIGLIMDVYNHSSQRITLRYIGINQESKDELYSLVQF